jgi:hypothetical protein
MKRTHIYFRTALPFFGVDAPDHMVSKVYELARLIAKKQGKANIRDLARIDAEYKPVQQWCVGNTHAENHMI